MKRSTTGLNVRFFRVAIATGHGRTGNLTGKTFSEQNCATDRGNAVTNGPLATKWFTSCAEEPRTLTVGISKAACREGLRHAGVVPCVGMS